jgi:hypothetical protein
VISTQHYLACLSHASYLIGDETTRRAVVADPRRGVSVYLQEAAERVLCAAALPAAPASALIRAAIAGWLCSFCRQRLRVAALSAHPRRSA